MTTSEEVYLRKMANKYGIDLSRKTADANPLENSMWSNMLDGALKAMEIVAIATFDVKLTVIVKLFQSWLEDRREEKRKREQQYVYGYGSAPSPSTDMSTRIYY